MICISKASSKAELSFYKTLLVKWRVYHVYVHIIGFKTTMNAVYCISIDQMLIVMLYT